MAKAIAEHFNLILPEAKRDSRLIIDMDNTHHVHYGDDIEGLWYNYKNQWCLQSHVAFDKWGLCHGIKLEPGNTNPGSGAPEFIQEVFQDHRQQRIRRLQGQDFFRGDSAYCNQFVIQKCDHLGLKFTITANKATTRWDQQMAKVGLDWQPWVYTEEQIKKAKKSQQELPRAELARFHWSPSWADEKLIFPIIVKRTWKTYSRMQDKAKKHGQRNLFELDTIVEQGAWEYYAIVTNVSLHEYSLQEVFLHHQARGNSENFHKEGKYNFHLKNFPCEKLLANKAWVVFAQIAYNLIHWFAVLDNPDHPSFAKRIRDDFMFIPGWVQQRSQQVFLRVTTTFKEVLDKVHGWQFPGFDPARIMSVPSG
jgi:hypothetical protein